MIVKVKWCFIKNPTWFIFEHRCLYMNLTASVAVLRTKNWCNFLWVPSCASYTSGLCSPSRLGLGTALVHRGFITKDTSVCVDRSVRPFGSLNRLWIKEKSGHYNFDNVSSSHIAQTNNKQIILPYMGLQINFMNVLRYLQYVVIKTGTRTNVDYVFVLR